MDFGSAKAAQMAFSSGMWHFVHLICFLAIVMAFVGMAVGILIGERMGRYNAQTQKELQRRRGGHPKGKRVSSDTGGKAKDQPGIALSGPVLPGKTVQLDEEGDVEGGDDRVPLDWKSS